jgi:hypothetical protein
MVIVEQFVEWRLTGETEVLGENLPQRHIVHHKSHTNRPGLELGPRLKPATNLLSYGAACIGVSKRQLIDWENMFFVPYIWTYVTPIFPPQRLTPFRREEVCSPQWPKELYWWERKLLVQPLTSDRSKSRDQKICSPWSLRLRVWSEANNTPRKNLLLRNQGDKTLTGSLSQ